MITAAAAVLVLPLASVEVPCYKGLQKESGGFPLRIRFKPILKKRDWSSHMYSTLHRYPIRISDGSGLPYEPKCVCGLEKAESSTNSPFPSHEALLS